MNILKYSRYAVLALGVFAALSSMGGFMLGFSLSHGGFLALACLMSGIALACYVWWAMTKETVSGVSFYTYGYYGQQASRSIRKRQKG
jgi:hypothetical protein